MTSTSLQLDAWIRDCVEVELLARGHVRKGLSFYRDRGQVIWVVEFQASRTHSGTFAVNVGVLSRRVDAARGRDAGDFPSVDQCHWRERLGVLASGKDVWWPITRESCNEVRAALTSKGLSALEALDGDIALRDLWARGVSPGLTRQQRAALLAALQRELSADART